MPIRVGVSFLPASGSASALRRRPRESARRDPRQLQVLPYVSEIVPIPDYYLHAGQGDGLTQIEQLSRLHRLDLFALVSYDQITDTLDEQEFARLPHHRRRVLRARRPQ